MSQGKPMKPDMYDIRNFTVSELTESKYIHPRRITYTQGGKPKFWDVVETHDSVAVLLYHTEKDAFVFVKQFRPAVCLSDKCGFTYELCAGLCDKSISALDTAREEILEETGYEVPAQKIERLTSFYTAVGFAGGKQMLYVAEIDESMKKLPGGGVDEEMIEVVTIPVSEARPFIFDESRHKTPGLMFAVIWFLELRWQK